MFLLFKLVVNLSCVGSVNGIHFSSLKVYMEELLALRDLLLKGTVIQKRRPRQLHVLFPDLKRTRL